MHKTLVFWVEPRGRLVEDEEAGAMNQARGQVQPADHPPGQGRGELIAVAEEPQRGQQLLGPQRRGAPREPIELPQEDELLARAQIGPVQAALRAEADRRAHLQSSGAEGRDPGHDLEEGGLAGAIGPDEHQQLAGDHRQAHLDQSGPRPKAPPQALRAEDGGPHGVPLLGMWSDSAIDSRSAA
jgi:hypothetical protein